MTEITRFDGMESQPNPDVIGSRWVKNFVFGPGNSYLGSRPGAFQVTTTLQPGMDGDDGGSFKYAVYSLKDDDFGHVLVYAGIGRVGYGPQAGGMLPVPLVPASVTQFSFASGFLLATHDFGGGQIPLFESYTLTSETFASSTVAASTDIVLVSICSDGSTVQWMGFCDITSSDFGWVFKPYSGGAVGSSLTFGTGDGGATIADYKTTPNSVTDADGQFKVSGWLGRSGGGFYGMVQIQNAAWTTTDADDTFLCLITNSGGSTFDIKRINNGTGGVRTVPYVNGATDTAFYQACMGITYAPDGDIVIHAIQRRNNIPANGQATVSHYILKINPSDFTVRTNYPAQLSASAEYSSTEAESQTITTFDGTYPPSTSLQLGPDDWIYAVVPTATTGGYPTETYASTKFVKFKVDSTGVTDFTVLADVKTAAGTTTALACPFAVDNNGNAVILATVYEFPPADEFAILYWNGTTLTKLLDQDDVGYAPGPGSGVFMTSEGFFAVTGVNFISGADPDVEGHECLQYIGTDGSVGDLVTDPTLPTGWVQDTDFQYAGAQTGIELLGQMAHNFDPMGRWLRNVINEYGV